jgi:ATP-binding cassette subfamily C protein
MTNEKPGFWHFSKNLLARYPKRSVAVLGAFLVAGLMEGLSAGSLLPLLSRMQGGEAIEGSSKIFAFFDRFFEIIGIDQSVGSLLILIIALFTLKGALQYAAMRQVGNSTASLTAQLRRDLIGALMRARWSHFANLSSGRIVNSIVTEADRAALSYLHLCKMIADIMVVCIYMIIAAMISWQVTLAAAIGGFVLMFTLRRLVTVVKQAGEKQTELYRALSGLIADAFGSFKPIKAMGRVDYFHGLLAKDTKGLWIAKRREVMGTELMSSARDPLLMAIMAAGLYASHVYIHLSLPTLIVLAFMFLRVAQKLTYIQIGYQRVASQESAYWAIRSATMDAESAAEVFKGSAVPTLDNGIVFDGLDFAHRRDGGVESMVLQNIYCEFPARTFSAVIGPSGAGKSTLLDLIAGFYRPKSGRILIDGVNLDDIDIRAWRGMIGYIPQEGFLLHDTIRNNITMGEDMTEDQILYALHRAGISDFVDTLPQGIDTMAGERGQMFSGGQRQRITLARALARDPKILLMDEPTSALDRETEAQLLQTLSALSKKMTIVVISHSQRVRESAGRVYILDKGRMELQSDAVGGPL